MEILTLVKANIRHKKGAFFGIAILMTILSMSLTAILSVRENCTVSVENRLRGIRCRRSDCKYCRQTLYR